MFGFVRGARVPAGTNQSPSLTDLALRFGQVWFGPVRFGVVRFGKVG